MAFSFDTFAKDQKQSAIDVVDTITPSQVKQVGAAYKAGLNASPKQVINETLESFTGVDLSQGAGVDGLGAQAKNFIEGQAASLTMQLEQQVLGCINTAIRDLMNKVPALDFILNFEDRINGILGKFRNKLEQKIDAELRKLTYEKIKVHQVTLFKQRIRGKIKDICPAATPASVAEVQDFNNKIKTFYNKRVKDNTVTDATKTLTTDKINEAKVEVKAQVTTPFEGISNKRKQTFQQDPVETKKIVDEKVAQASAEVKEETEKQLENTEDDTVEALVETEPIEEILNKKWSSFTFSIINNGELEQGGVSNEINTDVILNNSLNLINTETTNSAENKIQMLLGDKFATARAEQVKKLNVGDFMVEFTAESISYKIDHATGLKRSTISYSYKILEKKKFPVSVVTSTGQFSGLGDSYNVSDISTIKTIQKEIKKDVKAFIKLA
jgi:hypothetical protein